MKNQLLLIIFLFIGTSIAAQGLSGNRFVVFYNADYNGLNWSSISSVNRDNSIGYYNFEDDEEKSVLKSVVNLRHSLSLNYILNRRISTGLQFGFSRDSYGAIDLLVNNLTIPVTANYKYFSTEAEIKLFKAKKKGAIAPLGAYAAWRIGVSNVKTNIKVTELLFADAEETPTENLDFKAFSLALVLGNQFVVYKKMMINVGFEFKYNFVSKGEENAFNLNSNDQSAEARVLWNDIFRMRIGIGLAAF